MVPTALGTAKFLSKDFEYSINTNSDFIGTAAFSNINLNYTVVGNYFSEASDWIFGNNRLISKNYEEFNYLKFIGYSSVDESTKVLFNEHEFWYGNKKDVKKNSLTLTENINRLLINNTHEVFYNNGDLNGNEFLNLKLKSNPRSLYEMSEKNGMVYVKHKSGKLEELNEAFADFFLVLSNKDYYTHLDNNSIKNLGVFNNTLSLELSSHVLFFELNFDWENDTYKTPSKISEVEFASIDETILETDSFVDAGIGTMTGSYGPKFGSYWHQPAEGLITYAGIVSATCTNGDLLFIPVVYEYEESKRALKKISPNKDTNYLDYILNDCTYFEKPVIVKNKDTGNYVVTFIYFEDQTCKIKSNLV
jgi:hypothetical protein